VPCRLTSICHRERFRRGSTAGWLFYHTLTARHHRAGDRVASFYDSFEARAADAKIALDDDGRSRLRVHDLRHSRITWLLAEGSPIMAVSGLAGHSSVKMTERYYDYMDEHQVALTPFFANVRDRIEEYRRGTIAA
jgi:integrase